MKLVSIHTLYVRPTGNAVPRISRLHATPRPATCDLRAGRACLCSLVLTSVCALNCMRKSIAALDRAFAHLCSLAAPPWTVDSVEDFWRSHAD